MCAELKAVIHVYFRGGNIQACNIHVCASCLGIKLTPGVRLKSDTYSVGYSLLNFYNIGLKCSNTPCLNKKFIFVITFPTVNQFK